MAMRQDCKHFQSRTYATGDAMRKCALDLAPEAPWSCPSDCPRFERRLADVNWRHGSLITPATPADPNGLGEDPSIGALLDAAEDVINSAGPAIRAEVEAEEARSPKWSNRFGIRSPFRRRKRRH